MDAVSNDKEIMMGYPHEEFDETFERKHFPASTDNAKDKDSDGANGPETKDTRNHNTEPGKEEQDAPGVYLTWDKSSNGFVRHTAEGDEAGKTYPNDLKKIDIKDLTREAHSQIAPYTNAEIQKIGAKAGMKIDARAQGVGYGDHDNGERFDLVQFRGLPGTFVSQGIETIHVSTDFRETTQNIYLAEDRRTFAEPGSPLEKEPVFKDLMDASKRQEERAGTNIDSMLNSRGNKPGHEQSTGNMSNDLKLFFSPKSFWSQPIQGQPEQDAWNAIKQAGQSVIDKVRSIERGR